MKHCVKKNKTVFVNIVVIIIFRGQRSQSAHRQQSMAYSLSSSNKILSRKCIQAGNTIDHYWLDYLYYILSFTTSYTT